MEAHIIDTPSQLNRFHVDGMHNTNIVEWSKKRKPQNDQSDILRPKHKCWVGNNSPSVPANLFGENPLVGCMHIHLAKGGTDVTSLDDTSGPESVKDSNSLTEDSETAMSVNKEGKTEADSAKTCIHGRPSTSVDWDGIEMEGSSEEDKFVNNECKTSYQYVDLHDMENLDEHFLGLGSHANNMYSEFSKDSTEELDKEFEDIFNSKVENPNMYVLSSGRWNVNQEAQSSARPPTIDQEFEQYFSMLML